MSTHDGDDASYWPTPAATTKVLGLDIGMMSDHSAIVAAGAWPSGGRTVIGAFTSKQFQIGTPLDEVADEAAEAARMLQCKLVVDLSNNSAFASLLAQRLGPNPANVIVAATITNAADHASQPTPMMVSVGGKQAALPRWSLSKRELIENIAMEGDSGTLKLGTTGHFDTLREELGGMERTVRASGSVAYSAPAGKHDDMVLALALAVFGVRRLGKPTAKRIVKSPKFSARAWT